MSLNHLKTSSCRFENTKKCISFCFFSQMQQAVSLSLSHSPLNPLSVFNVRWERSEYELHRLVEWFLKWLVEESELSFLTPPSCLQVSPSLLLWWLSASGRPLSSSLCIMLEPGEPAVSSQLHPHQRGWKRPRSLHPLCLSHVWMNTVRCDLSLCLLSFTFTILSNTTGLLSDDDDVCVCDVSCLTYTFLRGQIVYYLVCVYYMCSYSWYDTGMCFHCRDKHTVGIYLM